MKYRFTILILAILALAGCQKENLSGIPEGAVLLNVEGYTAPAGSKTSVQSTTVQWVAGDEVNLSGNIYPVQFSGDGRAYVENPPEGSYFSYYPTDLVATQSSVTVPASYDCSYSNGRQVLRLPMVAMTSSGNNKVDFQHVTAAVQVLVKNTTGIPLILDRVEISSRTQQLNGSCSISFSGSILTVTPNVLSPSDEQKTVTVTFSDNPTILNDEIKEIQVPILPVNEGSSDLIISVYTHLVGMIPCTGYYFSRGDLSNPALARNVMMPARILFKQGSKGKGFFPVDGNGTKVVFSLGNLQYQASTGIWHFAEHQYDFIGNQSGNTTPEASRAGQSDWIDLFGWGTSGGEGKQPYMVNVAAGDYPTSFVDWGVNSISNAGNTQNMWRTLTISEWDYLLNSRQNSTVCNVQNARFAVAKVNERNGLILFPDKYEHPEATVNLGSFINQTFVDWDQLVTISLPEWTAMETAGAVFLPAAGYRTDTTVYNEYTEGDYWSATSYQEGEARRIMFNNSNAGDFSAVNGMASCLGYSVRLVKNAN